MRSGHTAGLTGEEESVETPTPYSDATATDRPDSSWRWREEVSSWERNQAAAVTSSRQVDAISRRDCGMDAVTVAHSSSSNDSSSNNSGKSYSSSVLTTATTLRASALAPTKPTAAATAAAAPPAAIADTPPEKE